MNKRKILTGKFGSIVRIVKTDFLSISNFPMYKAPDPDADGIPDLLLQLEIPTMLTDS